MPRPSNIKDLEYAKFVDSPTRVDGSAVEVVGSFKRDELQSIQTVSFDPSEVKSFSFSFKKKIKIISQKALRWAYSLDGSTWSKVGLGGWQTLDNVTAFYVQNLDHIKSNSVTIEVIE